MDWPKTRGGPFPCTSVFVGERFSLCEEYCSLLKKERALHSQHFIWKASSMGDGQANCLWFGSQVLGRDLSATKNLVENRLVEFWSLLVFDEVTSTEEFFLETPDLFKNSSVIDKVFHCLVRVVCETPDTTPPLDANVFFSIPCFPHICSSHTQQCTRRSGATSAVTFYTILELSSALQKAFRGQLPLERFQNGLSKIQLYFPLRKEGESANAPSKFWPRRLPSPLCQQEFLIRLGLSDLHRSEWTVKYIRWWQERRARGIKKLLYVLRHYTNILIGLSVSSVICKSIVYLNCIVIIREAATLSIQSNMYPAFQNYVWLFQSVMAFLFDGYLLLKSMPSELLLAKVTECKRKASLNRFPRFLPAKIPEGLRSRDSVLQRSLFNCHHCCCSAAF